jgi:ribosomal subunit interface protein
MQLPLQVTFRGFAVSAGLEARVREKAAKLERFAPHIMSCHVTLDQAHKHHHQGRPFEVRIDIRVPGHEIAVSRQHDDDLHVALRDAFDAAGRRLEDVVREMRGDVKHHETPGGQALEED